MLTFETLLVKELQKQQSRAEFCDIVLQSQGVSVPVHSCVLSAFSPFLCGALSAMPSPRNGQKRLIEVQSMESCTLLRLVSLLYSGQLHEDKGDVLSAACKLGISIPHRSTKRTSSEQNTQTDFTNTAVEKECQTETLSSENPVETVGASLWRSDQGLYTYADGSDITLNVALQNVPGNPEGMPSLPVMDVVHESAMYPTVAAPAPKRRGRPRKHPLPHSDASRNLPPDQKTVNLAAPSLMHTVALPAANPTSLSQPIDWLIDDVIAQLPLMPNNQHAIINTVTPDPNLKSQPSVKLTDPAIVQPQSEGELTDILDSFLRTFEQHIGACDADGQDAVVPSVSDGNLACGQSTSNAHSASLNTTTQRNSISKNRLRPARRPQKPSTYWQLTGLKMEKSPGDRGEAMPAVMTRSQSRKRKQEVIEELLRRDPVKRKKRKKERLEKTRNDISVAKEAERPTQMLNGEPKHFLSKFEPSKLRKVMNTASANKLKISKSLQQSSDQTCRVKKKRTKRDKTKPLSEGSALKMASSTTSSQPVVQNKSSGPRPALSAFDLVKQILESQQKKEREHMEHRMWTVKKQKGKQRVQNMHACGAKEKDDRVKMHSNSIINQKHEETRGRIKEDQKTTCLLQQPSDKERTGTRERLMENGLSRGGCETADSVFQRRSTEDHVLKNTADVTLASATPHEKLTDSSDEDVDVVEVSSSLSESFSVLPLTEVELSTDEEDSDEDQEIDVISVGSH